jgi:peptide-methionine (R)-S-oxide reductase
MGAAKLRLHQRHLALVATVREKTTRKGPWSNSEQLIMNRRRALIGLSAVTVAIALPTLGKEPSAATRLSKSKSDWKALLPPDRYAVLFEEHTERPFSSPLNHEKRNGTFVCAACFLPLFDTAHKFDSGTGWPSFWDALPATVGTKKDFTLVWPRTEYHCNRCGGHQGHVFNDGPVPTGCAIATTDSPCSSSP